MTTRGQATKRRRVRVLQKYLLNPLVKLVALLGLLPGHALIETAGRRTGKRRRTVIGVHVEGDSVWAVAEQGRHADYVANLRADSRVRLRLGGRWRTASASAVPDDDPQQRLDRFRRPGHAAAVRRFGTELLTVRIDLDAPSERGPHAGIRRIPWKRP